MVEVVVVVVVFPTILASSLDASPAGPDASPDVLASSDFAFRSSCLPFVVVHLGGNHWICSSRWRIWGIHLCLLLPDNPPVVGVGW